MLSTDTKNELVNNSILNPIIGENEGFTKENDDFGYNDLGRNTVKFFKNQKDPYVVMLSGEWGSGKTIFSKKLAGEFRKKHKDISVLEFDAFAYDYMKDAFLAITSQLLKYPEFKKLQDTAVKLGTALSIGLNIFGISDIFGIPANDIGKIIKQHYEKEQSDDEIIKEFREQLKAITQTNKLVIIIDELDRCRPDFSLSLLEIIKHFFNIPNIHFLLVTNKKQLCNSIEHCYGCKTDQAEKYLEKFYDIDLKLPFNTKDKNTQVTTYIKKFFEEQNLPFNNDTIQNTMVHLIMEKDISLRELSKILRISIFIINAFKDENYNTLIVFALVMTKLTKNDIYEKLLNSCNQPVLDSKIINEIESIFGNKNLFEGSKQYLQNRLPEINDILRNTAIKEVCHLIEQCYPLSNVKTISDGDDEQVDS